jgi:hypothetical protein
VMIGLILYVEGLQLEEEDCNTMIIKQRKNGGRRDQRIYFVYYHVEANANKVQFYSSNGRVHKCTGGRRSDYHEQQ